MQQLPDQENGRRCVPFRHLRLGRKALISAKTGNPRPSTSDRRISSTAAAPSALLDALAAVIANCVEAQRLITAFDAHCASLNSYRLIPIARSASDTEPYESAITPFGYPECRFALVE